MKRLILYVLLSLIAFAVLSVEATCAAEKQRIKAIGIPLADHYAGVVAYEKYREQMKHADYQLLILPDPQLVRAYFRSEADADVAFTVCPMIMDMFAEKPDFRWISLIHRDGNALAINDLMNSKTNLNNNKKLRKPDEKVAKAFAEFKKESGQPVECAVPSPLATHTTVLYKYMKDHNLSVDFQKHHDTDLSLKIVRPPKAPAYLRKKAARSLPAAFEQSLPWPEVAESGGYGHIAWYSKDVMKHPNGHVECVIIAKNSVIKAKRKALREVIYFIHKAGQDIESARLNGGTELDEIIKMIQTHIPQHNKRSIIETLRPDIMAINYKNLNVDKQSKESFRKIMELAFEAGYIKKLINIEAIADDSFSTEITKSN
ncbi:MAG: ABC transporter substrate-binding protein [Thermodesulfobacteriota bacterium]